MAAAETPPPWLHATAMTPSGLPKLMEGEITYIVKQGADVVVGEAKLTAIQVTSHRVMFFAAASAAGRQQVHICGDLAAVTAATVEPAQFFSRSARPLVISLSPKCVAPPHEFRVACRSSHDSEEVASELKKSMSRKAWVTKTDARRAPASRPLGIAGLVRQRELDKRHTGKLASEAFTDLQALMDQAQAVVSVMERYKSQIAQSERATAPGAAGAKDGPAADDVDRKQLHDLLATIGISSPVTKSSAGSDYHQQLSRELADFLNTDDYLERAGGMITLPDIYCVFNRARGLALISPDDLLEAASLLSVIGLGMTLRKFKSGVIVVQADSHADESMCERIVQLAREHTALSVYRASMLLDVSIMLAREHLQTAEELGRIARDEAEDGELQFYENLF